MQEVKGKVIVCITIVLMILAGILFYQQKNDRVLKLYKKITECQEYIVSMEEVNEEIKYKISVAKKNNDISIDFYTDNEHTSTLFSKGRVYSIMHNEQQYYEYNSDDLDGNFIISGLEDVSNREYTSGTEMIDETKYYYEEFEGFTTYLIMLKADENSLVKTKFYFEGNDLEYIKNIIYYDDGSTEEELMKVNVEYIVESSMFEIPEDYAEMEVEF